MISPSVLELPGWRDPRTILRHAASIPGTTLLWSGPDGSPGAEFSILAFRPVATFSWKKGRAVVVDSHGWREFELHNPFGWIREKLLEFRCRPSGRWPFPGGGLGYFSYDLGRYLEKIPEQAKDDRSAPWIRMSFHDSAVNWDHVNRRWSVLSVNRISRTASSQCETIARWLDSLPSRCESRSATVERDLPGHRMNVEESLDRPTYLDAVEEIQRRIVAGKCYEVNLSRRVTLPRSVDPHKLFDALCESSPAPFAAYMDLGDEILVGSSPERFLRIRGREAISSPIKGTAARHADPAADKLAGSALKGSRKDRAENVMIVDLVRNDLGRVCDAGSVRVRRLCELESFAGVHHLVSTISGTLGESHDALDAVQALFPPGSMTGAPKIAAMKVIESLEPVRRGPYAGAAGYLSATGDADLSVVIRSFVISPGRVDLQLGGAVVADSSPAAEYQETVIKGDRALAGLKKAVIGDQGSRGGESGKRRRLVAATPSVS